MVKVGFWGRLEGLVKVGNGVGKMYRERYLVSLGFPPTRTMFVL